LCKITKKQIVAVLEHHNDWRRGAEIEMINPKKLGKVIDAAISEIKKSIADEEKTLYNINTKEI